jgi:Tetrapyrrole (Corrin/Porphyrin) Methylases
VSRPSLVVVGTGLQASAQMSPLACTHVAQADKVLYLTTDVGAAGLLIANNAGAESLGRFYAVGKPRAETYEEIVEHVLSFVRSGLAVCMAVYGHPGVFAYATHESVRRARAEGYEARMLPAISAEDCLFADLGVDPADHGCQSYEATDFLVHARVLDLTSALILWQIGVVGNLGFVEDAKRGLAVLVESLVARYGAEHDVIIYRASPHPIIPPSIQRVTLGRVLAADVVAMSTLYVPPLSEPRVDLTMARRLGLYTETASIGVSPHHNQAAQHNGVLS